VNAVAIALGIRKALQNYKAYALSQNSAIGIGGKRARLATLRQGGCLAETRVHKHIGKGVDAACHHNVGTARLKLHRCLVHRRQAAGTRGIDHTIGPVQVKTAGYAACHDVAKQAGE
jgi:hypothetical protein